ncbi:hypothetical protein Trydic_g16340 [Trypoxylus dichotomus]
MQIDGLEVKSKKYASSLQAAKKIASKEGKLAFYDGLTASIGRQALTTSTRLGVYTTSFKVFSNEDKPPSFPTKIGIGMLAGICGGIVGTPLDLCLIRMVTDGAKPPDKKFHYKNVIHCVYKIAKTHGVTMLWKGGCPTIVRGIIFNAISLSTYSQSKQILLNAGLFKDTAALHFTASFISGLITSVSVLPVDLLKTRMQQTAKKRGVIQTFLDIFRNEGTLAYWKGFTPYLCRIVPYNTLTLVLLEQFTYYYNVLLLGNENPKRNL